MPYRSWLLLGTALNLLVLPGLLYSLWWLGMLLVSWMTSSGTFSAWGQPWIGMLVILVSSAQTYVTAGAYAAGPNRFKLTTIILIVAPAVIAFILVVFNMAHFLNS